MGPQKDRLGNYGLRLIPKAVMVIVLCIISVFPVKNFQSVDAASGVIICSDGSVWPPDAPIITLDNITYTLTDDIHDSVFIQRSNIIVNGNGHKIEGNGSEYGIYLDSLNNVTIMDLEIKGFLIGIGIYYCSQITLLNNLILNNGDGIYIEYSSRNNLIGNYVANNNCNGICLNWVSKSTLKNNRMEDNGANFGFSGGYKLANNIDSSNTVNGKPIYYWINQSAKAIPQNAGYVALINCTEITVKYLEISNNIQGILLVNTENSAIIGNNILNNSVGIYLYKSSFNSISENIIDENYWGAWFEYSSNNTFSGNVLSNLCGVRLILSSNNTFYYNTFNNTMSQSVYGQVYSFASTNIWDAGYPSGGNYWNDYVGVDKMRGAKPKH